MDRTIRWLSFLLLHVDAIRDEMERNQKQAFEVINELKEKLVSYESME